MANKSKWECLTAISGLIASVFIPIVLLIGGNSFAGAIKEKELRLQYVQLAVQILQQEASDENQNIRNWAIEVINYFSNIPINQATRTELKNFKIQPQQAIQPIIMDSETLEMLKKTFPDLQIRKKTEEDPSK